MKKIFTKSLAVIINIPIILGLFAFTAFAIDGEVPSAPPSGAAGENPMSNPFSNSDKECVVTKTPDGKPGPDNKKLITILEEGFETNSANNNPNYETRSCVRNTYQVKQLSTGKITTFTELLKECSSTAKNFASKNPDGFEIRFGCKEVLVILSKGGPAMIYGYIGMIYRWAARLVGLIAVLVTVLSGVQLAAAGGDQEAVNSAKKRIVQSLSGIAILFLSSLILNTINPTFYIISP